MPRVPWTVVAAGLLLLPAVAAQGFPAAFAGLGAHEAPVRAELAAARATVDGEVRLEAARGALQVLGPPGALEVEAAEVLLRVVRVRSDYVDNPLAGDVFLTGNTSTEEHVLRDARVHLVEATETSLVYAFQDGPDAAAFDLDLGPLLGAPFRPTTRDVATVVATPGMPWAFEHTVPAPAFGVGHGLDAPLRAPLRAVRVEGAFAMVVDHATVVVAGADRTLEVAAGKFRDEAAYPTPLGQPHYRAERVYAVLELRGGALRLDPDGAAARFLAPEPVYHLDGHLALRGASGTLQVADGARGLARQALELDGVFAVRPRAAGSPGLLGPPSEVRLAVEGQARAARLDGQSLLGAVAPEVRQASLAAVALGLLAAAWATVQKAFAPVLLPLYARLTGADLLSNRHRLRLYAAVKGHPFIHLRELQRATGLGFGTVAYHVALLKRERMVASVRARREERFYVPMARFGLREMGRLAALAEPARRRLAEAVLAGTRTQEALAATCGLSRGRVSRHLATLELAGLVAAEGARGKRYIPSPLLRAWAAERALSVGTPRPPLAQQAPSPPVPVPGTRAVSAG